jgi:hypothetical protein
MGESRFTEEQIVKLLNEHTAGMQRRCRSWRVSLAAVHVSGRAKAEIEHLRFSDPLSWMKRFIQGWSLGSICQVDT